MKVYKPFKSLLQVDYWGEGLGADIFCDVFSLFEEYTRALYPLLVLNHWDRVDIFPWVWKLLSCFNACVWVDVFEPENTRACKRKKSKSGPDSSSKRHLEQKISYKVRWIKAAVSDVFILVSRPRLYSPHPCHKREEKKTFSGIPSNFIQSGQRPP